MTALTPIENYFDKGVTPNLPKGHFIAGRTVEGAGNRMESYDPGRGEAFADFALATEAELNSAIEAAEKGKVIWRETKPSVRAEILRNIALKLEEKSHDLALVEVLDSGKTFAEALGDVGSSVRLFHYYAGAADKLDGRSVDLGEDTMGLTLRQPVGISAHIIPWNYPTSTFARGIAPALAAGCSLVVKPAETTPFTALMMAEICSEAGLPDGVLNVVTGLGPDTGRDLVTDPCIDQITFTGSVATGIGVIQETAPNIPRLTMELGGKSPCVVFDDSDLDQAVDGACWAIFSNAGQICSAGSRLVVQDTIKDAFLEKLIEKAKAIRFGHGLRNPDMGAINSENHLKKIAAMVEDAKSRGRKILTGGEITHDPETGKGWFFEPTIIDDLTPSDPMVQDEVFGPVLAVQSFQSEEEALRLANGTEFGLAAGVYTRDVARAMRMGRSLNCGSVTVNNYWAGGVELPFGGNGKSGYGREKGWEGLDAYTTIKSIAINIQG